MGWNQRGEWEPNTAVYATQEEIVAQNKAREEAKRQAEAKARSSQHMAIADEKIRVREQLEREAKRAEEAAAEAKHQRGVQAWKDNTAYNKDNTQDQGPHDFYTRKERRAAGKARGDNNISWADVEGARRTLNGTKSSQLESMRDLLFL